MTKSLVDDAIVIAMMHLSAAGLCSESWFCIAFWPSTQTAMTTLVNASFLFPCGKSLELSNLVQLQCLRLPLTLTLSPVYRTPGNGSG